MQMKPWLLDKLGRWLDRTGLAGWYARRDPTRAIAVMYHGVVDASAPYYHWCQLPLDRFRAQLDYLSRHHAVLPVGRLIEQVDAGRALPAAAAFITFDDGYRNNQTRALPELERRSLPATVFLSTGCVSQGRIPWPEELFVAFHRAPRAVGRSLGLGAGRAPTR